MSGFEVITITFAFVLGLGVAQILSSAALAIRNRSEQPLHWMPFSVAAVSFLFHIQFWFALVEADQLVGGWDWGSYGALLALAVLLFLSGGIVLPPSGAVVHASLLEDFQTRGKASLLLLAAYSIAWIPCLFWFIGPSALRTASFNLLFGVVALAAYWAKRESLQQLAAISVVGLALYGVFGVWQTPAILS